MDYAVLLLSFCTIYNFRGKNVLEKPELNKVFEKVKEKHRVQEWESQKKPNKRTSLEMKLEQQASRLKEVIKDWDHFSLNSLAIEITVKDTSLTSERGKNLIDFVYLAVFIICGFKFNKITSSCGNHIQLELAKSKTSYLNSKFKYYQL